MVCPEEAPLWYCLSSWLSFPMHEGTKTAIYRNCVGEVQIHQGQKPSKMLQPCGQGSSCSAWHKHLVTRMFPAL